MIFSLVLTASIALLAWVGLACIKALSQKLEDAGRQIAEQKAALEELRLQDKSRSASIDQIDRRFETAEAKRQKFEAESTEATAAAKTACDTHKSKVTWYVHELQQELSQIQTAGAHRERQHAKALAAAREQTAQREQVLVKRIVAAEQSSSQALQTLDTVVEWTITDKLMQLGGDHDSVRENTATMLESLRAKALFARLATKFPSAVAIDILESLQPKELYRRNVLDAIHALAEKTLLQKRYREAKIWFDRALDINNQSKTPDNEIYKRCIFSQSEISKHIDDVIECLYLFGELMEKQLILEELDFPGYQAALANVADAFERYADAETAVHIRKRLHEAHLRHALGDSPDAACNLTSLAKQLLKLGRYEEAVPVGLKALSICRMHFAPRDQRIQLLLFTLAQCFRQMRKLQRATDIYACLSAANIQINEFGQAETALEALESIAGEYKHEQKWQKAAEVYNVIERQYHKMRPQHPGVWRQLLNLAQLQQEANNPSEHINALERLRSQLRNSRTDVFFELHLVLMQLANLYAQRNDWRYEEPALTDAIKSAEAQSNQLHTLMLLHQRLAERRLSRALYADAEADYLKLLELFPNMSAQLDPFLAQTYGGLGNARLLQRNYAGAEEALQKQVDLISTINGADSPDCIRPLMQLSTLYITANRLDDARRCNRRVLELRKQHLGSMHEQTIASLVSLGALECLAGNFGESATYFDQALIAASCVDLPQERTAEIFEQFGEMEKSRGNDAKAKSLLQRATRLRSQPATESAGSLIMPNTVHTSAAS
ncbi:MAG TPA: tetratricopeptide repeat protein [Planktothrix sp.]|jgi:tetratricopeptide (TPR) repeat protein